VSAWLGSSWLVSSAKSVVICVVYGGRFSVRGGVALLVPVGEWISVVRALKWSLELYLVATFNGRRPCLNLAGEIPVNFGEEDPCLGRGAYYSYPEQGYPNLE
jgi:hypothetical protein